MNYSNLNQYKKIEVETNDPIKLIIMLFEGAINFTEKAKLRLQENNMADKGILISKTLAIVSELQGSLNMDRGGEVAGNMDRIYTYIRDRLVEANQKNDQAMLDEVLNHLRVLKSAWEQAQDKLAAGETESAEVKSIPATPVQQPQITTPQTPPMTSTGPAPESTPAIEIVGSARLRCHGRIP